jgi:hypothetical protein
MPLRHPDLEIAGRDLKLGQAFVVQQARKLANQFEIDGGSSHARTVSGAKGASVGVAEWRLRPDGAPENRFMAFTYTRVGARGNLSGSAALRGKVKIWIIGPIFVSETLVMGSWRLGKRKFNYILLYGLEA